MKLAKALLASAITLTLTETAHAALYDRGNGMIYDSTLNITWLQDANYVFTSGYSATGQLNWGQAKAWADNLVYGGYDDWRLPYSSQGPHYPNNSLSYDGSTDYSYNNTRSEIGHLFYELGNKAAFDALGQPQTSYGVTNTTFIDAGTNQSVSFIGVQNGPYREYDRPASNSSYAWTFFTDSGLQVAYWAGSETFAWAVRDGDVAAVPIPTAVWLFNSGLMGLACAFKRRKA